MTDIVERLRNNVGGEFYTWKTITEAADEIERLRKRYSKLLEKLEYCTGYSDDYLDEEEDDYLDEEDGGEEDNG